MGDVVAEASIIWWGCPESDVLAYLGGDTDTMACIAGNIAAATMSVPPSLATFAYKKLPLELREILCLEK